MTINEETMGRLHQKHPRDWLAAWQAAADREELSLSEWVGSCCNGYLPRGTVRQLSRRPVPNRPKGK